MAGQRPAKPKKREAATPPFRIRPLKQAKKESTVGGELFDTADELLWVMSQLKLLRHWPLTRQQQERLGSDLDFSKVDHEGQEFYELRLDDARLHRTNLRVFFWVYDARRTIWVVHGYWKKDEKLKNAVKRLVARRIRTLKGQIQDGSVKWT
jgi:phage-related protein